MTHMTGNGDAVKRHRLFQIMKEILRAERKGKDLMDAFRNVEPRRGGLTRFMILSYVVLQAGFHVHTRT